LQAWSGCDRELPTVYTISSHLCYAPATTPLLPAPCGACTASAASASAARCCARRGASSPAVSLGTRAAADVAAADVAWLPCWLGAWLPSGGWRVRLMAPPAAAVDAWLASRRRERCMVGQGRWVRAPPKLVEGRKSSGCRASLLGGRLGGGGISCNGSLPTARNSGLPCRAQACLYKHHNYHRCAPPAPSQT